MFSPIPQIHEAPSIRMLDAHDSDNAAGVPVEIFQAIFYVCRACGRYMTKRVSRNHHNADIEHVDLSSHAGAHCIYLQKSSKEGIDASKVVMLKEQGPLSACQEMNNGIRYDSYVLCYMGSACSVGES